MSKEEFDDLLSNYAAVKVCCCSAISLLVSVVMCILCSLCRGVTQEKSQLQEHRIAQLEAELIHLIESLRVRPATDNAASDGVEKGVGNGGGGGEVDLCDLQNELVLAKRELWKERLRSDAIRSANKKADEAMGLALANEKARASQLEEEYIAASLKIKKLEDINK